MILTLLLLAGCPRPRIADAPPDACTAAPLPVATEYYDVRGTTREELRASVAARGPGGKRVGVTTSEMAWTCRQSVASSGAKRVTALEVDASLTVLLPRWRPPRGADAELVEAWDTWMRVTEHHEQGHVDIAQRWLRCAADDLAAQPDCEAVRDRAAALRGAMTAEQDAYDEETQHGILQGSRF